MREPSPQCSAPVISVKKSTATRHIGRILQVSVAKCFNYGILDVYD